MLPNSEAQVRGRGLTQQPFQSGENLVLAQLKVLGPDRRADPELQYRTAPGDRLTVGRYLGPDRLVPAPGQAQRG